MAKGDIVLIPFPFTDLSSHKLRPALVLVESDLDLTLSFITTQVKWKENTDIELAPSNKTGIKKQSLIRLSKIATLDKSLVIGKLGHLQPVEIKELNMKLKTLFKLH
jgi:mRNA interferase MazF